MKTPQRKHRIRKQKTKNNNIQITTLQHQRDVTALKTPKTKTAQNVEEKNTTPKNNRKSEHGTNTL